MTRPPPFIAVRPPEYWPGLATMALAAVADTFVLADTFQYSRQSFQNRARLRTPDGWQWISVPLRGGQHGRPIRAVAVDARTRWARRHLRAMMYNYRTTPFYEFYEADLRSLLDRSWESLAPLTCATVEWLHRALGCRSRLVRASAIEGVPADVGAALEAVGGGRLLVPEAAAAVDVGRVPAATVVRFEPPRYAQNFAGFEPGMSTLDLLFNYGPESLAMLGDNTVYALESSAQ